jgi:hypothetical protein
MQLTRREFMRGLGVALASVLMTRCTVLTGAKDEWDQVREAWNGLDTVARDAKSLERGEKTRDWLIADHQIALDKLVQSGKLDAAAAEDMQMAFQGAAQHVWRANAPITCYKPAPYPMYGVESASNLAEQADILAEMAGRSNIDPATVAQAQAAIERDMAFLALSPDAEQSLMDALRGKVGQGGQWPTLAELDLDVQPETLAAVRTLVDVLLGKK